MQLGLILANWSIGRL